MLFLDLLFLCVALTGHFAACVRVYNRMHARHLPRWLVYLFDRAMAGGTIAILLLYLYRGLAEQRFVWDGGDITGWEWLPVLHAAFGSIVCLLAIPLWIWPRIVFRPPAALLREDVLRVIDVAADVGHMPVHGSKAKLLARLPGNLLAKVAVHEKELRLPNWPAALDGLTIVQLSDLHMTGHLTLPFYECMMQAAAELGGDLLVLSGDILENDACLPWIEKALGKLRAPLGQFYVLGNHELRLPDVRPLVGELATAGWTSLVGQTTQLEYNGQPFVLAGSSRPWFGKDPELPAEDILPKVLLAHTPDLFPWAQRHLFQLILAGHTHGGQIRLPFIGPLISPSSFGFRYASGVFQEGPTVMHVSRGLSGEHVIRINCPPEITKLVLRAAK